MKKSIISLLFISPLFAFAQSKPSSDIKVSAKIEAGCLMSANNINFNFDGSEIGIPSVYHPNKLKVFNNYQDLNIKVHCSKGTNVYLYSKSPQYPSSSYIYTLKHNTVSNAPSPTYWFTFKSVTDGARKITSVSYVRIHNGDIKLNFKLDTPVEHTLTFSAEIDYESLQKFIPGNYSDTINLAFDY